MLRARARDDVATRRRRHDRSAAPPRQRARFAAYKERQKAKPSFRLTDELRAAIEACARPDILTYLHTKAGAPHSPESLGSIFRSWRTAAGLPKRCTLHGLRKGGARRLAEAGATAREIMSITGHKTMSEVQRYTDAADKAKLAEQAIEKLSKRRGTST